MNSSDRESSAGLQSSILKALSLDYSSTSSHPESESETDWAANTLSALGLAENKEETEIAAVTRKTSGGEKETEFGVSEPIETEFGVSETVSEPTETEFGVSETVSEPIETEFGVSETVSEPIETELPTNLTSKETTFGVEECETEKQPVEQGETSVECEQREANSNKTDSRLLAVEESPVIKRQSGSDKSAWMVKMAADLEARHSKVKLGKLASEKDRAESDAASYSSTVTLNDAERKWLLSAAKCEYHILAKTVHLQPEMVNCHDYVTGYTALHWGAKKGHCELIKLLAGKKARVNKKSNGGYTPLHLAVMFDHLDAANLLITVYGAEQEIRDNSGRKPFDYNNNVMGTRRVTAKEIISALRGPNDSIPLSSGLRRWSLQPSLSQYSIGSNASASSMSSANGNFGRIGSIKKAGSTIKRMLGHRHSWGSADFQKVADRNRKAGSSSPIYDDKALMPPPKDVPRRKLRN